MNINAGVEMKLKTVEAVARATCDMDYGCNAYELMNADERGASDV